MIRAILGLLSILVVAPTARAFEPATEAHRRDLSAIHRVCVPEIRSSLTEGTVIVRGDLIAAIERVGYQVLDECTEAKGILSVLLKLETRKNYATSAPPGHRAEPERREYLTMTVTLQAPDSRVIWTSDFDELYLPGEMKKISHHLSRAVELRLKKDRGREMEVE